MGLSAFNVWAQSIGGGGYPAETYSNPLFQFSLPELSHAHLPVSLGTLVVGPMVGKDSFVTLIPLIVMVSAWTWRAMWAARPHEEPLTECAT